MSYIDVTGRTEEEAIAKALSQLGMDRDDVSVQILERAKQGFLGLGSAPAVIRVTYGEEEPAPAPRQPETRKSAPVFRQPEPPRAEQARPAAPRAAQEVQPAPVQREAAPVRQERAPRSERPVQSERPARSEKPRTAEPPLGDEVDDEKAQEMKTFLSGLLTQMEASAQIKVYQPEKGRYKVFLEGENLGALIGRRGETLDAIQQLTSYCVNRSGDRRVRIQLDAENYRERREESLEHLAEKVAGKVVKYRRSVTLEAMNAYERHVIHTALQEVPNVTTYSTGVEPNRRVIVSYDRNKQ